MNHNLRAGLTCLAITFILEPSFTALMGQHRLPDRIDSQRKTILHGSRNRRIEGLVSEGAVESSMPVNGITFRFKPTHEQQMDLERLLEDQQDSSSPQYRAWLSPEEYSERFGLSSGDMTKVVEWIASQGFHVDYAAKSRTHISFSGTAAQVRKTFGAELHYYRIDGKKHFANQFEIEIPRDIEDLVYAIRGLDDLPEERAGKIMPLATNSATGAHGITPGDLAVIYNLSPLYKQGITGDGQKIIVAGESGINLQDVRKFRDTLGLPPNDPKIVLMPGVRDPGINGALAEALLDVEFAGGAAPRASILYVYGPNAARATEYAVDQNLAPVISYSFASCETQNTALWGWFRNVVQQAAVQGMTWVAASGDTGPAACESQSKDSAGASGVAVNLPASVPEVTGVGGTELSEDSSNYWSAINSDNGTSARSYIPERAWNRSGNGRLLSASGGGASAAYPRPNWQTGPGVPDDNSRHVPDIAFTASREHDPYLIVLSGDFATTGGTSASTPFFAGVVALLNQFAVQNGLQPKPGLGNINPRLYQLAQNTPGIFHDVSAGNNIVPCKAGTPDCITGQYGYRAGSGYDEVTGLGSIDIAKLFEAWPRARSNPNPSTNVVISVDPSPVYQQAADEDGYQWYYTVQVRETGGAPARILAFSIDDDDMSEHIDEWFGIPNLPARGTLAVTLRARDVDVPSEHIFALSGVDTNGKPWSRQISVPFLGEKSTASMSLSGSAAPVSNTASGDPNCSVDHPYYARLILRERNGMSVKLNKLLAAGSDYTGQIESWFGSTQLPSLGTLQAGVCWALASTPAALLYEIGGVDEHGQSVQATLQIDFKSLDDTRGPLPVETVSTGYASAQAALTTSPSIEDAEVRASRIRPEPAPGYHRK